MEVRNTQQFPEVDLALSAFDMIGGPAQSSSYQWINGRASTSRTLIYTLVPLRPGQHTIGPLVMQYNGQQYTSNSVTITVMDIQSSPSSPGTALQQPGSGEEQESEVVFIRAIPNKIDVFTGEQINVSY
ncbi:MAG: protein BatD, partial [Gammaproteobacteria bacterium]|nr:protein BatD [Gammaproteobacteria bacterium]NIR94943.1 protein BatD [Gammaproteobacteria bacterium]